MHAVLCFEVHSLCSVESSVTTEDYLYFFFQNINDARKNNPSHESTEKRVGSAEIGSNYKISRKIPRHVIRFFDRRRSICSAQCHRERASFSDEPISPSICRDPSKYWGVRRIIRYGRTLPRTPRTHVTPPPDAATRSTTEYISATRQLDATSFPTRKTWPG